MPAHDGRPPKASARMPQDHRCLSQRALQTGPTPLSCVRPEACRPGASARVEFYVFGGNSLIDRSLDETVCAWVYRLCLFGVFDIAREPSVSLERTKLVAFPVLRLDNRDASRRRAAQRQGCHRQFVHVHVHAAAVRVAKPPTRSAIGAGSGGGRYGTQRPIS